MILLLLFVTAACVAVTVQQMAQPRRVPVRVVVRPELRQHRR